MVMHCRIINICVIVFLIASTNLLSQNTIFSLFKKDQKRADKLFNNLSYLSALELYKKVLEEKGESDYVNLQIARSYKNLNRSGEAEEWYAKVVGKSTSITSGDKQNYAEALQSNGKYFEAKDWFRAYLLDHPGDSLVFHKMESLSLLSYFFEDSLSYSINQLPINSELSDFSPSFYGNGIVFLSSRKEGEFIKKIDATTNDPFLDIYYSEIVHKDSLSLPEIFKDKINTKYHEGPISFFDNDRKAIFTKNATHVIKGLSGDEHITRLELFYAEKGAIDNSWKKIKPLPFNSPDYSTAHPSFSEKTNTLYFVSNKPGGYGGTDIYLSHYIHDNWSLPENLGPKINTEGNEMFPFIYGGNTLCFASNGHPGLGGLDLFYAVIGDTTNAKVKNIGYPINSEADDFGMVIERKGNSGYFSSNRKNGKGADDIYSFKIFTIPLSGLVADKVAQVKLENVAVRLMEKGDEKSLQVTESDGVYYFNLKPGREYAILATKEGYKDKKIAFSTKNDSAISALPVNILLERRSKAFVKGTIKDPSGQVVADCKVSILNRSAKELVVYTDKNGEFKCEVDADAENMFIAKKFSMIGMEKLKVEKMKKGSVVLNIEMELQPFRTYDVRGILKEEKTHEPLSGYEVLVKNLVTKEEEELCTDQDGKFGFNVFTYASYDIVITFGKKKSSLKGFVPKQDHEFEIFWIDK